MKALPAVIAIAALSVTAFKALTVRPSHQNLGQGLRLGKTQFPNNRFLGDSLRFERASADLVTPKSIANGKRRYTLVR